MKSHEPTQQSTRTTNYHDDDDDVNNMNDNLSYNTLSINKTSNQRHRHSLLSYG